MRAYLICTVGCSWCDVHLVSLLPTLLTKTRAFLKLHVHIHTYSRYYFPLSPKNCFIVTLYFLSIQLREFIFGVGWSFYCLKSFFQGKKFFNLPFPCHHIHEMMIIFPKTLILFSATLVSVLQSRHSAPGSILDYMIITIIMMMMTVLEGRWWFQYAIVVQVSLVVFLMYLKQSIGTVCI